MNFSEIDAWLAEAEALRQRGNKKAYETLLDRIYQNAFPGTSSWKTVNELSLDFENRRVLVMAKALPPTDRRAQTLASAQESLQNALFPFARRMEPLVRSLVFKALFGMANSPGLPREISGWNAEAKGAFVVDIGAALQLIVLRMARRFRSLWQEAVKETHTLDEQDYFKQYQSLWDKYDVLSSIYDQILIMHRLCDPEMIYVESNLKLRDAERIRRQAYMAASTAKPPRDTERDSWPKDFKENLKERPFAFDDRALIPADGAKWMRFAALNHSWYRHFSEALRSVVLTERALGIDLLLRTDALASSFYAMGRNADFAVTLADAIKKGRYWSRSVPPGSHLKLAIKRAMTTEREVVRSYLELCGPTCYWTLESAHLHDPAWKQNGRKHFDERKRILAQYDAQVKALS